jgi:hypothetical protein
MAAMPETQRAERMLAMVQAEYTMSDQELRAFTTSRLKVWLALPEQEAKTISAAYDAAMLKMPGPQALRRVAKVQTVARVMSADDLHKLRALIPNILGALPNVNIAKRADIGALTKVPERVEKKGWWPFGKKAA